MELAMQIEWTPALLVGDPEIDAQHQEFIARINALLKVCNSGGPTDDIEPITRFLAEYVEHHFGYEERVMEATRFAGADEHTEAHQFFRDEFNSLKVRLRTEASTPSMLKELHSLLVDWFVKHIATADVEFARYLAARRAATAMTGV